MRMTGAVDGCIAPRGAGSASGLRRSRSSLLILSIQHLFLGTDLSEPTSLTLLQAAFVKIKVCLSTLLWLELIF